MNQEKFANFKLNYTIMPINLKLNFHFYFCRTKIKTTNGLSIDSQL